jgi:hypothetical protein
MRTTRKPPEHIADMLSLSKEKAALVAVTNKLHTALVFADDKTTKHIGDKERLDTIRGLAVVLIGVIDEAFEENNPDGDLEPNPGP